MNLNNEICKAFHVHAARYEQFAKIQYEIGSRLLQRLQYLKIKPRFILDLGCGPGMFSRLLKKQYPDAQVVGLDLAYGMLAEAKRKQGWRRTWSLLQSDMLRMPFATGTFDLVFANQAIHWAEPMAAVMAEINRVMHTEGCFMFSTMGPDTFGELKHAWCGVDQFAHVNEFLDMHDLGDLLLSAYFLDPVVDMEKITACYASFNALISGLKAQGIPNVHAKRNPGLTGKHRWLEFKQKMHDQQTIDGKLPLTYEVVYGHAWKANTSRVDNKLETRVSIADIPIL